VTLRRWATLSLCLGLALVSACSRQQTERCEPNTRYTTARSVPPVQIPDDLSPPSETDALRLPADPGAGSAQRDGECLESPPSFFRGSRLGRGTAETPAATPPANAEPADPPADPGRVIDN
jgi:hypothetical protein